MNDKMPLFQTMEREAYLAALREIEAYIAELEQCLANRDARIASLEAERTFEKELVAANLKIEELQKEIGAKQARIDSLMLEWCPEEMTAEQIEEWAKNQRVSEREVPKV